MDKKTGMERKNRFVLIGIGYFIIFHLVGLTGFHFQATEPLFRMLVPLHLIMTAFVLFYFHENWSKPFLFFMVGSAFISWLVEVAGVQTGAIFGDYQYGKTLGLKIMEAPVLIGLNWLVMVYTSAILVNQVAMPNWLKPIFAASLMLLTDFFIEPVAMEHGYWSWAGDVVPIQNYLAWFALALLLQFWFFRIKPFPKNPVAPALFIVQLFFFLGFFFF